MDFLLGYGVSRRTAPRRRRLAGADLAVGKAELLEDRSAVFAKARRLPGRNLWRSGDLQRAGHRAGARRSRLEGNDDAVRGQLGIVDDLLGDLHHAEDHPMSRKDSLPVGQRLAGEQGVEDLDQGRRIFGPSVVGEPWVVHQVGPADRLGEAGPVLALGRDQQDPTLVGGLVGIEQGVRRIAAIVLGEEMAAVQAASTQAAAAQMPLATREVETCPPWPVRSRL